MDKMSEWTIASGRCPHRKRQIACLSWCALAVFAFQWPFVQSVRGEEPAAARIGELVTAFHQYRNFEGVVLVADGGAIVYHQGFGLANREWGILNTTDTRFLIASVTKPFTAVITTMLAQRGLIDLRATISTYLPTYRRDTGDRVTVHQLLTHSSGIPNYAVWPAFWDENPPRMKYDRDEFVKQYCSGDLIFTPGDSAQYSDANYYLLAMIIERVTGRSFEEVLAEYIFKPLGMTRSGIVRESLVIEHRAYGYLRRGQSYSLPPYINYEDTQLGCGDMYATVEDLFRLDHALYTNTLLPAVYRDSLFGAYSPSGFSEMSNGYGWNVGTITLRDSGREIPVAHAPGNNAGFTTVIYRLPEMQRSVIIATNVGPGPLDMQVYRMCREITNLLYGETYEIPKPSIVDSIAASLDSKGIEEADRTYRRLTSSGEFDLDTGGMNRLGYRLLSAGRVDEAIKIFRLNVESNPTSANAYDSLGEGYMKRGDRDLAIENYRKSLELNPANDNAREMLAKLGAG